MNQQKEYVIKGAEIMADQILMYIMAIDHVDNYFRDFNSARLREVTDLFAHKMFENYATNGLNLSGILNMADLESARVLHLIKPNFIDWLTGKVVNINHYSHFTPGCAMNKDFSITDVCPAIRLKHCEGYRVRNISVN